MAEAADEDKPALLEAINRHLFEDEDEGEKEVEGKANDEKGKSKADEGEKKGAKQKKKEDEDDFRFDSVYQFLDCPIMRNLTVGGTQRSPATACTVF